jgi:hypothetical protein
MDSVEYLKNQRLAYILCANIDPVINNALIKYGYIAGGAVLSVFSSKKINDYDLYFYSKELMISFLEEIKFVNKRVDWSNKEKRPKIIKLSMKDIILIHSTDNADTFIHKNQTYQVIKAFFGSPLHLFRYFDYSVCMGAYLPSEKIFHLNSNFLLDIASGYMHFNIGTEYPIASLVRLSKYMRKGYKINGTEMIKIALCINNLNIKTYADLKKHLLGIDTQFLAEITIKLESEPNKEYDYNYFLTMLDECLENINSKFDINEDM